MLEGLDTINWASLTHAHGEATDVPGLVRSLLSENSEVRMEAIATLHENPEHASWLLPAIDAALASASDENIWQALAESKARLTSG